MGLPPTESGFQGTEVILAFLRLQADYAPGARATVKRPTRDRIKIWLAPMRRVVAIAAAKDCATHFPDRP